MGRAEMLERWAEHLFERHGGALPVDIGALARQFRVVIEELPLSDQLDGAAIPMPEVPGWCLVVVNRRRSHVRKRFTVAHELSHVVLHLPPMAMARGRMRSSSVEWEANRLAACLLMPRRAVLQAVRELGPDAEALARRFDVSRRAMEVRLEQLGLLGGAAVCNPGPPSWRSSCQANEPGRGRVGTGSLSGTIGSRSRR